MKCGVKVCGGGVQMYKVVEVLLIDYCQGLFGCIVLEMFEEMMVWCQVVVDEEVCKVVEQEVVCVVDKVCCSGCWVVFSGDV